MALNDGPFVKIKGGAWVYLLEWQHRDDGWWAKTSSMELTEKPQSYDETLAEVEAWHHQSEVLQISGQDYSRVPRSDTRSPS